MLIALVLGFLAATVLTLLVGGGGYLAWTGARSRLGDVRRCHTCRFNLSGHEGEPDYCPECGHNLIRPWSIDLGEYRTRPRRLATGLALAALGAAPFVAGAWWRRAPAAAPPIAALVGPPVAPRTVSIAPQGSDAELLLPALGNRVAAPPVGPIAPPASEPAVAQARAEPLIPRHVLPPLPPPSPLTVASKRPGSRPVTVTPLPGLSLPFPSATVGSLAPTLPMARGETLPGVLRGPRVGGPGGKLPVLAPVGVRR